MKNFIKSEKGVSLVSLAVAVMVLMILTGIILYNAKSNIKISKVKAMEADVENLTDKVASYYAQYGMIPANTSIEYTNLMELRNAKIISSATDTGKFYVIDLSAMENITLNYGQDYEKIRNGSATTPEQINQLRDLYIINETSHNIFYVAGITMDNYTYYTNYDVDEVDKVPVTLRYENVAL